MPKGGWSLFVSLSVHAAIILAVLSTRAPSSPPVKKEEWYNVDLSAIELPKPIEVPASPAAGPIPVAEGNILRPSAAPKLSATPKAPKGPKAASPVEPSPIEGGGDPTEGPPAEPAPLEVAPPSPHGTLPTQPKAGPGGKGLSLSAGDFIAIAGGLNKNTPKPGGGPGFSATELNDGKSAVNAGNQMALGPLAGAFSKYLHLMHLQIHREWGDKMLDSFAKLDPEHPLNRRTLEVTLELVILPDGTLESANVIRTSGEFRYDASAQKAVFAAAPFPAPPKNLRSYLDKVYIRWSFFRDERECVAVFAQPYRITGPEGGTPIKEEETETPTTAPTSAPVQEKQGLKERAKDLAQEGAEYVKSGGIQLTPASNGLVRPDGFGGQSELPDHSVFSGEEPVIINFNAKGKGPTIYKDEPPKKKKK